MTGETTRVQETKRYGEERRPKTVIAVSSKVTNHIILRVIVPHKRTHFIGANNIYYKLFLCRTNTRIRKLHDGPRARNIIQMICPIPYLFIRPRQTSG